MQRKRSIHISKGMSKDISDSKLGAEYYIDALNIRLTAAEGNTLMSITNAKGNRPIQLTPASQDQSTEITGSYLGHAVLNDYIVLFTVKNSTGYIYRIDTADNYKLVKLAYGPFGFDLEHPIETLPMYEKEDIQKIYWIDGKNQPRFINIADKVENGTTVPATNATTAASATQFDFVATLKLDETVSVTRNETTIGAISAGVIQYVFTYYNPYGQESNIFHQSSLHYISYNNRGASAEDTQVSASFSIKIQKPDPAFQYVRIYSIHRTSLDSTPTVRRVIDLPVVSATQDIIFTDDGTKGDLVDPTVLLYIGGKTIVPQAMGHKDNTLFFGNYQEKGSIIPQEVKDTCRTLDVSYTPLSEKTFDMGERSGYYSYKSGLTKSLADISTFKYLEWYRFGIQVQKTTGEWSEPIFLKDKKNDVCISYNDSTVNLIGAKAVLPSALVSKLKAEGYTRVRPLVVYPTLTDRECICQAVLNPTVFNVEDRKTNSPWSQSSWFFRPNSPHEVVASGSGGIEPSYSTHYCIPVQNSSADRLNVGDHIWLEYYDTSTSAIALCEFILKGVATSVSKTNGESSEHSYAFLMVDFQEPAVPLYTLTADQQACTRDLKVRSSNSTSTSANIIGRALYVGGSGSLTLSSLLISDAVLKAPGQNAVMNWNPEYSHSTDNYIIPYSTDVMESNDDTPFTLQAAFQVRRPDEDAVDGTISEFRHWKSLPSAKRKNGEIQCNFVSTGCLKTNWESMGSDDAARYTSNFTEKEVDINPVNIGSSLTRDSYVDQFSDFFFVDQSVLTFHSPDIEFDTNTRSVDNSLLKMRIVGYVPITSTISDVDIQASTLQLNYRNSSALPRGFWHETVGGIGLSGVGSLNAAPMWYDEEYHGDAEPKGENKNQFTTAFMTYPWHRNGSLNNQNSKDKDGYRSAMLKRKVMSNMRFSYQTQFLADKSTATKLPDNTDFTLSGISLFDSNEVINSRINGNIEGTQNINYYGNIDKIVTSSRVFRLDNGHQVTGYPIFKTSRFMAGVDLDSFHKAFTQKSVYEISDHASMDVSSTQKQQRFGSDPVHIKYKSTPHAVVALQGQGSNYTILPTAKDSAGQTLNPVQGTTPFWSTSYHGVSQKVLDVNMSAGWLWVAELYNDQVINRFGGDSKDAIENNTWLPCGQVISLDDAANASKGVRWTEGDTYYQRYDCLKTYPFTTEDTNSIVDILSFMCETRVNIDGRYDRNRGQNSNLHVSPTNFNLLNPVYSQKNNFFNYRALDQDLFNLDTYKNYVTWTKTKTPGEKVDTWTNITLANVLDLDGDKGTITAIKRFNNNLFAFQDQAFCQILYNENTQISTTTGVPIEIANSGKVTGKRYISETVGCSNKWSIVESPYGLYFMDSNNATINLYNGTLEDITSKYGFTSWSRKVINKQSWTPAYNTFRTFYDGHKKDVYFVNKDQALNFSEGLGQFSSFISYENTPAMFNVGNKFYAFKDGVLYEQDGGDYGVFFGQCKPYHVTFVDNQDFMLDKTYTNLEFRAVVDEDMSDGMFNLPFDKLTATTDYQSGTADFKAQQSLVYSTYPSLMRKFRIWRADIPRSFYTTPGGIIKQDRMRNPWIHLKLEKKVPVNDTKQKQMEMHDLIVDYYV